MKKVAVALAALVSVSACGILDNLKDEAKKAESPIKGAKGDKAAAAGFRAAGMAVQQVNGAVSAAAGSSPGAAIPNVQPEAKSGMAPQTAPGLRPQTAAATATGFEGPVAGPDGTEGWYKQTYAYTNYGNDESSFDVFIKSDPAQDMATAWPASVKKLFYAWRGTSGYYEGYAWDSEFTVYSANRIGGVWSFKVSKPAATNTTSYANYYYGSEYSGEFDFGGSALGGDDNIYQDAQRTGDTATVRVVYDYANNSKYALHFENRYDGLNAPLATPQTSDWYGAWQWNMTMNQLYTISATETKQQGPFTFDTLWYWGMGTDPKDFSLGEPAYSETATPAGADWADPGASTASGPAPGLYYWSKGSVKAADDYTSVFASGATQASVTGTCTGTSTALSYQGGKKCTVTITDCKDVYKGLFPICYGN